jgi:hypothetical protein
MNIFYVEKTKTEDEEGFEDFVVLSSVGELPANETTETTVTNSDKDPSQMSETEINALYGLDDLEPKKSSDEDEEDDLREDSYY